VVSGERAAVERIVAHAKEFGARRAMLLKVGGAFHSPLMAEARDELSRALDEVEIDTPGIPVVMNVTATATRDPETIRSGLKEQLTAPVLWLQTLQTLHAQGVRAFLEIGPGKVLQGLTKRTLELAATSGVDHAEDLTHVQALTETPNP
jgi:[acyl-carrier-protein] S-malonyltransferase